MKTNERAWVVCGSVSNITQCTAGPYESRAEAERAATAMVARGLSAWIEEVPTRGGGK